MFDYVEQVAAAVAAAGEEIAVGGVVGGVIVSLGLYATKWLNDKSKAREQRASQDLQHQAELFQREAADRAAELASALRMKDQETAEALVHHAATLAEAAAQRDRLVAEALRARDEAITQALRIQTTQVEAGISEVIKQGESIHILVNSRLSEALQAIKDMRAYSERLAKMLGPERTAEAGPAPDDKEASPRAE